MLKTSDFREWTESPVTELVREALEKELEDVFANRAECFYWDDPNRTHTDRAFALGKESLLRDPMDVLSGDVEYLRQRGIFVLETEEETIG